jgi:hypothetical protein
MIHDIFVGFGSLTPVRLEKAGALQPGLVIDIQGSGR